MNIKLASVNSLKTFLSNQKSNTADFGDKISEIILTSTLENYENYVGKSHWNILSTNKEEEVKFFIYLL